MPRVLLAAAVALLVAAETVPGSLSAKPNPLTAEDTATLFEEGDFSGWATIPRFPATAQVSGARQTSGGNPGAHYLVTQMHPEGSGFGVASESRAEDRSFRVEATSGERLEFRLDHAEDETPQPLFPADVYWAPLVVQGGRTFRSLDGKLGVVAAGFRSETLVVARNRFRAIDGVTPLEPDFSAGAPPVRAGVFLQTIRGAAGTVRVRLDNLRVRRVPAPAGAPDLWVTKTDGLEYLCDEHDVDDCGPTPPPSYTIRYGNRGPQPATGVVLTDLLPPHLGRAAAPWQCSSRDGQGPACTLALGQLAPGASGEVGFRPVLLDHLAAQSLGFSNLVSIADDGTRGPDQNPGDNASGDDTAAILCADDLSGSTFCCAIRWLAAVRRPGASVSGPKRSLWGRVGALTGRIFETAADLHLFYRIREEVFRRTPGGRRAIALYDEHTTEITRLLARDAGLRDQALATLELWKPSLEALVAGSGAARKVSASELDAVESFLDRLEGVASVELRQLIARERDAIGLASLAGSTLDQGLTRLNRLVCEGDERVLCLGSGRFRVEMTYATAQGASGSARAVALTPDSGYFTFFDPSNVEAVIKVLGGCGVNQRYWVFAAGLTNVRVVTTVTDTRTGKVRTYTNPQGSPFQPLQDTNAFATCP